MVRLSLRGMALRVGAIMGIVPMPATSSGRGIGRILRCLSRFCMIERLKLRMSSLRETLERRQGKLLIKSVCRIGIGLLIRRRAQKAACRRVSGVPRRA